MTKLEHSPQFYQQMLEQVIAVALEAGQLLLEMQKKVGQLTVVYKPAQGVASAADQQAEELIVGKLQALFPAASFLAEESFHQQRSSGGDYLTFCQQQWCWLIDPLDGTHNFLSGLDYYSVSIALAYQGQAVLGVVYRPATGDLFAGTWGGGAKTRNVKDQTKWDHLVPVVPAKNAKDLQDCLLVTGFSTEKGIFVPAEFRLFEQIAQKVRGVRRMGSAALDLCYLATGVFDGLWERDLAPWDVGAGGIICLEAQVQLTNFAGERFHPYQGSVVGARSPLYQQIMPFFSV